MVNRDAYLMLASVLVFYILAFNGVISRAEGILFLLIYISYTIFLISSKKVRETYNFDDFLDYFLKFKYL